MERKRKLHMCVFLRVDHMDDGLMGCNLLLCICIL
jgi:hypothetical protein